MGSSLLTAHPSSGRPIGWIESLVQQERPRSTTPSGCRRNRSLNTSLPSSLAFPWSWTRQGQGGEGMDSRDQAGTVGEGRQDQVLGGDLPLLSAHQGARDH